MSTVHVSRPLLLAAQLAPFAVAAVHSGARLAAGAPATTGFALVASLAALGVGLAVRGVREFLIDLAAFLVERVPLAVFVVAMLVAGLLATRPHWPVVWCAATAWLVLLTTASILYTRARDRRQLVKVLALLGVNLALLVFVDWVIGKVLLPTRSHNNIFIQHDAVLGWKLRPNFQVDRRHQDYRAFETTNALGFRSPELPFEKPDGTLRIVVLGDSHSEGYTVGDGKQYTLQLAAKLRPELPVEVISLGVAGYSNDQELLSYLRYGRRYSPDVVILQFTPNDVRFNVLEDYWRGSKPRFRRHGDHLLLEGVPVPDDRRVSMTRHPLLGGSSIAMIAEGTLGRMHTFEKSRDVDLDEAWIVTELLVRDIRRAVEADGAELVMFNAVPDQAEVDVRVRALAERQGVPFIDVTPAFAGDVADYRIRDDLHWNERGHESVAALLADALRPRLVTIQASGR